ncbi:DUF6934 family protein [Dyadobacter sp.]|uniref:DUF6934 family protein n=1 Tax=Dyadobacter sp. TaxID=1914288 RepID=UPI003F71FD95
MKHAKYSYQSEQLFSIYKFKSEGLKGSILKVVKYTQTEIPSIYNLAFGDFDPVSNDLDDLARSDNGDSKKVLITVASTLYSFFTQYPTAAVLATGSTSSRTRLYQIVISNNLPEILEDFSIFGYNEDDEWEEFMTGVHYKGFLVRKKTNN